MSAFTTDPSGGNPAGVWIGDELPAPAVMQQIAADVGYSETAFIAPSAGPERQVRYYSPRVEIPFCGHATIATGAVLGDAHTVYRMQTAIGEIPVTVTVDGGQPEVSLTSVDTKHRPVPAPVLDQFLTTIGWCVDDLDTDIPPAFAFAGAWHLILAAADKRRLATLDYDFDALRERMLEENLITLQLVWRENAAVFHSRNPFPVGGVVEDPATGAAAAALGGYLRDAKLITAPAAFVIRQGEAMGRPSLLSVRVPVTGGIVVAGTAVEIDQATR